MLHNHWFPNAIEAAKEAGKVILEVYNSSDFSIEIKGDDSPLTKADKLAHNVICSFLEKTPFPILSEEGRDIPFEQRSKWDIFWLVDPLDGTKEFIKRNGEFTVNIALIEHGTPIFGVVYAPVLDKLYYGSNGQGAKCISNGAENEIKCLSFSKLDEGLKVVASRSHMSPETEAFIGNLKNPSMVSMGSSLKFMILAEGNAALYPRYAPTMEWDTAAAQAVVEAAGGRVYIAGTTNPLQYNKPNLLNPHFLVVAQEII